MFKNALHPLFYWDSAEAIWVCSKDNCSRSASKSAHRRTSWFNLPITEPRKRVRGTREEEEAVGKSASCQFQMYVRTDT